jgi:hypothetical protein
MGVLPFAHGALRQQVGYKESCGHTRTSHLRRTSPFGTFPPGAGRSHNARISLPMSSKSVTTDGPARANRYLMSAFSKQVCS